MYQQIKTKSNRNRAVSGISGQNSGTRIILSILQSFQHFLNAKYISNNLK